MGKKWPQLPTYPCAYFFYGVGLVWQPKRPLHLPNSLKSNLTSDLKSVTQITYLSMCILFIWYGPLGSLWGHYSLQTNLGGQNWVCRWNWWPQFTIWPSFKVSLIVKKWLCQMTNMTHWPRFFDRGKNNFELMAPRPADSLVCLNHSVIEVRLNVYL